MKAAIGTPGYIDGHVDLVYEMMRRHAGTPFPRLTRSPVTLKKLARGNVRIFASACYCADRYNGPDSALPHALSLLSYSTRHFSGLVHIKSSVDLDSCFHTSSRPGYVLTLENSDSLLEFDLEDLKGWGIRIVGLTHAGANRLGDGNAVSSPRGLTAAGKRLAGELGAKGFAIDVAHLSEPAFQDLIRVFDGPILSSHTGFRFFHDIPRNLRIDQLKILFERGGIAGITVNPEMLAAGGTADLQDVFRHVDWIVQNHGPDHAAIGTDFCGFDELNRDLPDISGLPLLASIFERNGYPAEAVRNIMGFNWYRLYSVLFANT